MQWLTEHWLLTLPMALGAVAVWQLMPKGEQHSKLVGGLIGLVALGMIGGTLLQPTGHVVQDGLFYLFAAVAVIAATLMITHRNPAYSALWFAVVTLSVCGLFLLQSAPFLASATVIVYAGAIIVTFLFVLMLAQQAGNTTYDQYSRQPGIAVFTGFVLLGALLFVLSPASKKGAAEASQAEFATLRPRVVEPIAVQPEVAVAETPIQDSVTGSGGTVNFIPPASANGIVSPEMAALMSQKSARPATPDSTSTPTAETFGTMRALGRSLFGDYLFAVELAGTLLLVATIAAIVIAPKRSSGKF